MVPASLSLLLASVPAKSRSGAIGAWSAVGALGAALGPVVGGSLVQLNWRWVFWINLPVGLAAALLAARVVPESKDERAVLAGGMTPRGLSARPDLAGAGLLALAVGLLALALVKAPTWGWGSASFIGLLLASLVCGAAVVVRSRRHHSPVIELGLLRSRTFSGAFGASILYYAGFGALCSIRWSFSPACGTTARSGQAWPSPQGRSWSFRSPGSSPLAWPLASMGPAG
jgi:MFS family permease